MNNKNITKQNYLIYTLSFFIVWFFISIIYKVVNIDFINLKTQKQNIKVIEKTKDDFINIYAWWDIMLSRTVWHLSKKNWYDRIFKDYNPITSLSGWIAIFNLESPFGKKDNDKDIFTGIFRANFKNSVLLKEIIWNNIWVFSIANNHILNAWKQWYEDTKDIIRKEKFNYTWDYESNYFSGTIKWQKICIWWYSYDWNNKNHKKADKETILEDLKDMTKNNCFLKIIVPHWWREYKFEPTKKQEELAHFIIDNWADLIIWSHSHIAWKVEVYENKYIFYSLWNYIFDQNWWMDWCDSDKDCIYDETLKKETVPTYIWTLINIQVNLKTKEIKLKETIKTRIDYWKIDKF